MSVEDANCSLEEGEILDSGSENDISNETAVSSHQAQPNLPKNETQSTSQTNVTSPRVMAPPKLFAYQQRSAKTYGSDDDDDDDSDSDVEAENDSSPVKKPFRSMASRIETGMSLKEQHGSRFMDAAMDFQTKRANKKNNVWGSVITEQTLNQTVGAFNMDQETMAEDDQNRGVEHYNFNLIKQDPRIIDAVEDDDMFDIDAPSEEEEEEEEVEEEPNLFDKEVFGTGNARKRTVKDRLGKRKREQKEKSSREEHEERDGKNNDRKAEQERSVSERLGQREFYSKIPEKPPGEVTVKETDPPEQVAVELVDLLNEPSDKVELFKRVVETLGARKSLDLYYMTESVEATGGMLIMNGYRRRTPGGVYIQLLKTDSDVTKDHIKEIFKEEMQAKKEWKKEMKKKRSKLRAQRAGTRSIELPQDKWALKDLPLKKDVLTIASGDDAEKMSGLEDGNVTESRQDDSLADSKMVSDADRKDRKRLPESGDEELMSEEEMGQGDHIVLDFPEEQLI